MTEIRLSATGSTHCSSQTKKKNLIKNQEPINSVCAQNKRCFRPSLFYHINRDLFALQREFFCSLFFVFFVIILLAAGLGHISAGCVARYTDQLGCVLASVTVSRVRLTRVSGCQHSYHSPKLPLLEPQRPSSSLRLGLSPGV